MYENTSYPLFVLKKKNHEKSEKIKFSVKINIKVFNVHSKHIYIIIEKKFIKIKKIKIFSQNQYKSIQWYEI